MALCALARPHAPRPANADRGVPAVSGLVPALAVALVAASPPVQRVLSGPAQRTAAPAAAAGWLAANPQPGRMFNYQPWGSYLELRLGPRVRVGFDSRIELPPADRWDRYVAVSAGRWDAERVLDGWGVDHVVTSRRATPALIELLEASGRWRLAFSSGDELIYLRVGSPGTPTLLQGPELALEVAQEHRGAERRGRSVGEAHQDLDLDVGEHLGRDAGLAAVAAGHEHRSRAAHAPAAP